MQCCTCFNTNDSENVGLANGRGRLKKQATEKQDCWEKGTKKSIH